MYFYSPLTSHADNDCLPASRMFQLYSKASTRAIAKKHLSDHYTKKKIKRSRRVDFCGSAHVVVVVVVAVTFYSGCTLPSACLLRSDTYSSTVVRLLLSQAGMKFRHTN